MKNLLTLVLIIAALGVGWAEEGVQELRGTLQVLWTEDGQSYFAIDSGQIFEVKSDVGGTRRGQILQLAGMDDHMLKFATEHEGAKVVVVGRPFGATTVHHYTDVLWLAESIQVEQN